MSINHLLDKNTPVKLNIVCNSCECEAMKVFDKMEVKDLTFDCQNGDPVELSTLPDQGVVGAVLKSDGGGGVIWGSDLTGGVNYTGSLPTVVNGLTVYNGVDGTTLGDTALTTQDIVDLQNDKLNKDGTNIMTGSLQLGGNSITGVNNITAVGTIAGNINANSLQGLLPGTDIPVNTNMNFLNVNNILNLNNLETQEIKATDGVSINIQDDINVGLYDLNNVNDIRTNAISTNTAPNIISNNNIDMNTNDLLDVGSMTITSTAYISKIADLPAPIGNYYVIPDNTTWIFLGQLILQYGIEYGVNCSVRGIDISAQIIFDETFRDCDIKAVDNNFYLSQLTIIGGGGRFTGLVSVRGLLNAQNYNVGLPAPIYGRDKRFKLTDVNILRPYKIGTIEGYGTLNIVNNFFNGGGKLAGQPTIYYTNAGISVSDGLSLEFNSNKMVLMLGAQQASTLELLNIKDNVNSLLGFNAVTITGNIFHPRDAEIGINFENSSTTELGNISSNTFIRTGGTGRLVNYLLASTFDNYAQTPVVNYDIEANAGIVNSSPLLKSIVGTGTQITAPATYTDLPFPISNILALNQCKRIGLEIELTGVSGSGYTAGNFLESTTGGLERYYIAEADVLVAGVQTIVITDMSAPIPDVLGSRELDKSFVATGIVNTGITNTTGDITPIYRYFDKDPRQVILQASLSYENDTKDETLEFRPIIDQGGGYINTDDCSVITTAVKQNQQQSITITCAILCNPGTKLKFQVKQVPPDVANVTIGKMVITCK